MSSLVLLIRNLADPEIAWDASRLTYYCHLSAKLHIFPYPLVFLVEFRITGYHNLVSCNMQVTKILRYRPILSCANFHFFVALCGHNPLVLHMDVMLVAKVWQKQILEFLKTRKLINCVMCQLWVFLNN